MDITKGSWNYWACGAKCEGGLFMTNGGCECACVKKPISCTSAPVNKPVQKEEVACYETNSLVLRCSWSQADKDAAQDALAELNKQYKIISAAADSKRKETEAKEKVERERENMSESEKFIESMGWESTGLMAFIRLPAVIFGLIACLFEYDMDYADCLNYSDLYFAYKWFQLASASSETQ